MCVQEYLFESPQFCISGQPHVPMQSHRLGWASAWTTRVFCPRTRTGQAKQRAVGGALVMICTSAAMPPHAEAVKYDPGDKQYPARMQQILEYIQHHPMHIGSQPMYYEPSQELHTPLPDIMTGLTPADVMPVATSKAGTPKNPVAEHFARTVAALLYVATGGLDHAHNLVTPLCWGSSTNYAGPPIAGSPAARDAAYVHALVHRAEGFSDGEFGSGFSNANYWYSAAGAATHPISKPLLQAAQGLAEGNPKLEQVVSSHGDAFNPAKFVATCSKALASKDPELTSFCDGVVGAEWSLLLRHCYKQLQEACS